MTKRSFGLFLLAIAALGGSATGEPHKCSQCPERWVQGEHFNATIDDCASLHGTNQRNLESWASAQCGTPICLEYYQPLSCTTDASGTTVVGRLYYRCDCTQLASADGSAEVPVARQTGCGLPARGGETP